VRISVIVPTLNEAARIAHSLEPLQALRGDGHELIVVDGGSSDATLGCVEPFADRCLTAVRGRASQMNAGAEAACGDVLWFVHADTRAGAEQGRAVVSACADAEAWGRFDVRLSGRQLLLRAVERMMNLRSRVTGLATGDQALFVTRRLFDRVGGFPQIPLMEDIEISRRLRRLRPPLCLHETVVTSSRRWETQGVTRTMALMWYLRAAYAVGVPAHRLAALYDK
jgi:rSAM/selenodomain-associated transferase 2